MSDITIITNHQPRDIVDGWDVPASVRAQFDYVDWAACDRGEDTVSFFTYRGDWFDLGDIPARTPHVPTGGADPFHGWDGLLSDSFFSGIVVRYTEGDDTVVVGRFYS